jgi:hypothetical protein
MGGLSQQITLATSIIVSKRSSTFCPWSGLICWWERKEVKYNFLYIIEEEEKYDNEQENEKYKPEPSGCHHPSFLA